MKTRTRSLANVIVAAAFCCAGATALAMPKAAEDENAQVSNGINAARPKHSSAKPPAVNKAKAAKPSPSSKKTKSAHPRK